MMEVEKRSSKGGFLQLFDWNLKSRKKLFSTKSDVSEGSKQGKENLDAVSRIQQIKGNEHSAGPSLRGSDYASSVSNDEGYGSKAPGVVARLMGLDSLPTTDAPEPSFTPFSDHLSFRDSYRPTINTDFQNEMYNVDYGLRNKLDGFSRNPIEDRLQKLQNRPIEKFQVEILPPKSAKSVPITHHRLLSPIKTPEFILTRNATFIMEAAAKIIEQSPQSKFKGKSPSFGLSSGPIRFRELKEKMEAAQKASRISEASKRPSEQGAVKYFKAQSHERSQTGPEGSFCKQNNAGSLRNRDKPASVAVQAKLNIQSRDSTASKSNKNLNGQKEIGEFKLGNFDRKQRNASKSVHNRMSTGRTSDVLRQNNQKQNSAPDKDRISSKSRVNHLQERKAVSTKDPKTSKRLLANPTTGTRKVNPMVSETGKETSVLRAKNFVGKKRPINGDIDTDGSSADGLLVKEKQRSVRCNVTIDGCTKWDHVDRKNSMDVVSFTFTSPIKKSVPRPQLSDECMSSSRSLCLDPQTDQSDSKTSALPFSGLHAIDGDALGVLLEQKLKELAFRVESSKCNLVKAGSFSSSSSNDSLPANAEPKFQGAELMEDHSSRSKNIDYKSEIDFLYPSMISSREPSMSDESCISYESKSTSFSNGNKQFFPSEAHIMSHTAKSTFAIKLKLLEGETELQDSASSISEYTSDPECNWELDYITEVLNHASTMLDNFALGQGHKILSINFFDQLESRKIKGIENSLKSERRVLFDYVSVYLEERCKRVFCGNGKGYIKCFALFGKKEVVLDELSREISGLTRTSAGDFQVDELVEKDMSSQYGKWVDFDLEAFEEGEAIANGILTCLVEDFVDDLLMY